MSKRHGSSGHDNRPSCVLERLPHLVRNELLSGLAYPDIKALVAASPIFLEHYTLDRSSILRRSLPLTLGHAYVEAVAAFESSSAGFQRTRSREGTLQFIASYKRQIQHAPVSGRSAPSNEEAAAMMRFHIATIAPLMDTYADWALSNLDAVVKTWISVDACETSRGQKTSRPLSPSERTRITRALYRFQLFCNLFGTQKRQDHSPRTCPAFTAVDILANFFSLFEPWEVEEVLCIYILARDKISSVFGQIKSDVSKKNPRVADERPPTPEDAFDMDNSWMRDRLLQGTISRGLRLLRSLFTQDRSHEELVVFMKEQIATTPGEFLGRIAFSETPQMLRRGGYPSVRDTKEENRDPLPFMGDGVPDADGLYPPLAWTLIWGGTYSNLYGPYVTEDIRRWGYVIWDADRLRATAADQALVKQWESDWEGDDPRENLY